MGAPPAIADLLRMAGLRRTPARLAVLAAVQEIGAPTTHAQLAADPRLAGMDPVTLYRTLAALQDAGLVHRVPGTDGVWRTCPHAARQEGCPGNHAHFLCLRCGAMRCLPDQPMPRVEVPPGARVLGRHLLAFGTCEACAVRGVDEGKQSAEVEG